MIRLLHGDAVERLRELDAGSVDCVVTDPPYPCIKRDYGTLTEAEWMALMQAVVRECRRVLKPRGSAVFVLQPNFERLGRMRTWLLRFNLWAAEEWNWVQDAYWWNYAAMPGAGSNREIGLLRSSIKFCIWLGQPDCYRNQEAILWLESEANLAQRLAYRAGDDLSGRQPSGHSRDRGKMAGAAARWVNPDGSYAPRDRKPSGNGRNPVRMLEAATSRHPSGREKNMESMTRASSAGDRGLVTPFNVVPVANTDSQNSSGAHGHGAGTPLALCLWWVRYLCPPGGTVLDPFNGAGTVGIAARRHGADYIGIEKDAHSIEISRRRIEADAPLWNEVEEEEPPPTPPPTLFAAEDAA